MTGLDLSGLDLARGVRAVRDLGLSDCEVIQQTTTLAQPVNAITSLAYVLAGVWLIARGRPRPGFGLLGPTTYGALVIAIGLGSVAYHGPQPAGAAWLHDAPIAAVLLFMIVFDLRRAKMLLRTTGNLTLVALLVVFGVLNLADPLIGRFMAIPLIGALVILEVLADRATPTRAPRILGVSRSLTALVLLLTAVAIANTLGRTGGPLCDPGSLVQLHGIWHIGTAAVFWIWGTRHFSRDAEPAVAGGQEST